MFYSYIFYYILYTSNYLLCLEPQGKTCHGLLLRTSADPDSEEAGPRVLLEVLSEMYIYIHIYLSLSVYVDMYLWMCVYIYICVYVHAYV